MGRSALAFCLLFGLLIAARFQAPPEPSVPRPAVTPTRIAFGSCNQQVWEEPIWPTVIRNKPQLWIWLGNAVYHHTEDLDLLRQHYTAAKNNPGYQQLLQFCPAIGIWGEHDYGTPAAGGEYAQKAKSKQLMLEFFNEPTGSPRWKREGAYVAYQFGEEGRRVKIILLDTRYFRDSLRREGERIVPNHEGDLLGETQWQWLEDELTNSSADIHLIGSSIQLLPDCHSAEKWADFPASRERFLNLVAKTQPRGLLLMTSGSQVSEISEFELPGYPYPVYEFTTGGLTQVSDQVAGPNPYRVGRVIQQPSFSMLRINWNEWPLTIDLQVRSRCDSLLLSQKVSFVEQ